jgi:hypothetical protein
MNNHSKISWRRILITGVLTFIAAPVTVLLHELAHIIAFTLAGIPSHLVAFGMAMPVGYQWNIESLQQAQLYYGAGTRVFVFGVLAGPLLTLALGYGGLLVFRRWKHLWLWAIAFSAIGLRMVGVLTNAPKIIAETINTSDEVLAAYFLGRPSWVVYWPSLAIGLTCVGLLITALPKQGRFLTALTGLISSLMGFLAVESLFNLFVFHLKTWTR